MDIKELKNTVKDVIGYMEVVAESAAKRAKKAAINAERNVRGFLTHKYANRPALERAVFLTAAMAVSVSSILVSFYTPSYAVSIDGVEIGRVSNVEEVSEVIDRVEERAGDILGRPYTLEQTVAYGFGISDKEELLPAENLEDYLFDHIGEVSKLAQLSVDGKVIGATKDMVALADLLDDIKASYTNGNTVSAEFVESVKMEWVYGSTDEVCTLEDIRAELTALRVEEVTYAAVAGDTLIGIAKSHDMTLSELLAINPQHDPNTLFVGDVLILQQQVPYLSVCTVERQVYEDVLPFEIEEQPDDSMYEGEVKILTQGVNGSAIYDVDVTKVNGNETERMVNSITPTQEAVTQVQAVGTKERPKTMATGKFKWPLSGRITSYYGNRRIFGSSSFHSGLDIAAPNGTRIAAADGGKVVFAGTGTGSSWSLGKYVTIDHENGLTTTYAHCSSLDVKVGERVYKGQTIARVGSTGRSTGNHCHFMVKVNGSTTDPLNYLP